MDRRRFQILIQYTHAVKAQPKLARVSLMLGCQAARYFFLRTSGDQMSLGRIWDYDYKRDRARQAAIKNTAISKYHHPLLMPRDWNRKAEKSIFVHTSSKAGFEIQARTHGNACMLALVRSHIIESKRDSRVFKVSRHYQILMHLTGKKGQVNSQMSVPQWQEIA